MQDILHRTFTLGNIPIPGRMFLAPMAGITDDVMRLICKRMGCAFAYTEMVSAKGYLMSAKSGQLLSTLEQERPVAAQLFGHEPQVLAQAAQKVEREHAGKIALIDLNMGCPATKIVRNGEGSALLKNTALAGRIIEAVVKAVKLPVTVKIRKGYAQDDDVVAEMTRMARDCGAAAITVHGRSREQGYSGTADWDAVAKAVAVGGIPVIGNGDLHTMEQMRKRMEETGCDAVMIGRGAIGNPWVFAGRTPERQERFAILAEHLEKEAQRRGESIAMPFMRKQVTMYLRQFPGAGKARAAINEATTVEAMKKAVETALCPVIH